MTAPRALVTSPRNAYVGNDVIMYATLPSILIAYVIPILRQHYVTSTYITIFISHRIRDVPNTTAHPSTASVPTFYFMCYISS